MRIVRVSAWFICGILFFLACSRDGGNNNSSDTTSTGTNTMTDVDFWLTKGDSTVLLQKQNTALVFGTTANNNPFIDVDSTQTFQTIDGFGFTFTGGSAYEINRMDANSR